MNVKTSITCTKCNYSFVYGANYSLEEINEREMGKECFYEDSFVDEKCPHCNGRITGTISYWEYPEDVLETFDCNLSNAKVNVSKEADYEKRV